MNMVGERGEQMHARIKRETLPFIPGDGKFERGRFRSSLCPRKFSGSEAPPI